MNLPVFKEMTTPEKTREYIFPNGSSVIIENVAKIAVSSSGNHRIETTDGGKHIVSAEWIQIKIIADSWSF